jgi:hypothetical protein
MTTRVPRRTSFSLIASAIALLFACFSEKAGTNSGSGGHTEGAGGVTTNAATGGNTATGSGGVSAGTGGRPPEPAAVAAARSAGPADPQLGARVRQAVAARRRRERAALREVAASAVRESAAERAGRQAGKPEGSPVLVAAQRGARMAPLEPEGPREALALAGRGVVERAGNPAPAGAGVAPQVAQRALRPCQESRTTPFSRGRSRRPRKTTPAPMGNASSTGRRPWARTASCIRRSCLDRESACRPAQCQACF